MRALILCCLLAAGPATSAADLVFRTDTAHVRLGTKPCTGKVAQLILPEWRDKFKDGFAVINGRAIRICWIEHPEGTVTILDEDGDAGQVPLAAFKEAGV